MRTRWRHCDHEWVRFIGTAASGVDMYECLRCGARRRRTLPPKGYHGITAGQGS
jgi:hypothetical protein